MTIAANMSCLREMEKTLQSKENLSDERIGELVDKLIEEIDRLEMMAVYSAETFIIRDVYGAILGHLRLIMSYSQVINSKDSYQKIKEKYNSFMVIAEPLLGKELAMLNFKTGMTELNKYLSEPEKIYSSEDIDGLYSCLETIVLNANIIGCATPQLYGQLSTKLNSIINKIPSESIKEIMPIKKLYSMYVDLSKLYVKQQ